MPQRSDHDVAFFDGVLDDVGRTEEWNNKFSRMDGAVLDGPADGWVLL
jgi:hypothetical protein